MEEFAVLRVKILASTPLSDLEADLKKCDQLDQEGAIIGKVVDDIVALLVENERIDVIEWCIEHEIFAFGSPDDDLPEFIIKQGKVGLLEWWLERNAPTDELKRIAEKRGNAQIIQLLAV